MPLERRRCEKCQGRHSRCPECESWKVTRRERFDTPAPHRAIDFEEDQEIVYKHVCWECGWEEKRKVTIETLDT